MESSNLKPRESTILFASGAPESEIEQKMKQQILEFGDQLDQKQEEFHQGQQIELPSKESGGIGTRGTVIKEINEDKPMTMSGTLHKKSPTMLKGWQQRFVVLKDKKLRYFKKEGAKYAKGCINFEFYEVTIEQNEKDQCQFTLKIVGQDKRTFEFKAATADSATSWQKEILRHIGQSNGFLQRKTAEGLKLPWRFDNMSESQFKEIADTGDILLFRGSHAGGKLTRTFTASHFDHTAMILKFQNDPNEVFLVEATGNMGVSLNRWDFLREHVGTGKFYEKLVLRHINFDRNDDFVQKLETFLSEAVGSKYGLNAGKLTRQKTQMMKNNCGNTMIAEDRTFFCSELNAKAYKCLGIIEDNDINCGKFLPHNFSSRGDSMLKLTTGTTIDEEQQIIVDDRDLQNEDILESLPDE